jgi:hypothetical protein
MGKFYEDLETLNELIKKIDKKNQLSEFIIKAIRKAKENPDKSVSDVIKETKKKFD